MRQAAGIMLIIFGIFLLNTMVSALSDFGVNVYQIVLNLLMIIPVAFLIAGEIFCLRKNYWRVCFASAWLSGLFFIIWWAGSPPYGLDWLPWVFSILGTLSIIFVYLTKKERKEVPG